MSERLGKCPTCDGKGYVLRRCPALHTTKKIDCSTCATTGEGASTEDYANHDRRFELAEEARSFNHVPWR